MMDSINFNQVSVGAEANALTQNMVALQRYRDTFVAAAQGYKKLTGTISTSSASATVTGSGTRFSLELSIGQKIMKEDHVTVLGYVAAIASDTSLTLVANATSTNTGVAATYLPMLVEMVFGDSVGAMKTAFLIPIMRRVAGSCGHAGYSTGPIGGATAALISGTWTVPNGVGVPFDYTYSTLGVHHRIGVSSVAEFSWSGPYVGNLFRLYYVKGPDFGPVTIELLDNTGALVDTISADAYSATVELGVAEFNRGATTTWGKLRVTTTADDEVVVLSTGARNTILGGHVIFGWLRPGLAHADFLSCPNPHLTTGIVAREKPCFATYEMREGGDVSATFPQVLDVLMDAWSETDWLVIGTTPGTPDFDAGTGQDVPRNEAPTWIENESMRKVCLQREYAYFDGYTPCGSYSDMKWRDPAYDGAHAGDAIQRSLAHDIIEQFNLFGMPDTPISPAGIVTPYAFFAANGVSVSLRGTRTETQAFRMGAEPAYGLDGTCYLGRWFDFKDWANTYYALRIVASPTQGVGIIAYGGLLNGSLLANQCWSLSVASNGSALLRSKDNAGNVKDVQITGRSSTVAALPPASANVGAAPWLATNGRKAGEGVGAGTGCPVWSDGTNWLTCYDNTIVAA